MTTPKKMTTGSDGSSPGSKVHGKAPGLVFDGDYSLSVLRERKKETVKAISIPDMEKKKKKRMSLSFIDAYLLSSIPT